MGQGSLRVSSEALLARDLTRVRVGSKEARPLLKVYSCVHIRGIFKRLEKLNYLYFECTLFIHVYMNCMLSFLLHLNQNLTQRLSLKAAQ